MKKTLSCILFLCLSVAFGQRQAANWYFGENAGIQFDRNYNITALSDGRLFTKEGCSSISDNNGNLLFYTDGSTVYNRNHSIMDNGRGLLGNESSTQSAIVIPNPVDSNIYYIFTVGSNNSNTGMKYSIVDMTLDSGLGGVTLKNRNLIALCSEKIAAVLKDCETGTIWVVGLSNFQGTGIGAPTDPVDTFHAFEVTSTGINTTPVRTTISGLSIRDARGYLKFSPDGTQLACASPNSGLDLFDFDLDTGIVSNRLHLNIPAPNNEPYGAEFSPNNQVLYVTASNDYFNQSDDNLPRNHHSKLIQFDLTAPDIESSALVIDNRDLYRSALQLGPDGKIYRSMAETYESGLPFLSTIENPNQLGAGCDYQHQSISLGGNNSTQGLPPFIASFFAEKIDIIRNGQESTFLGICDGETYTLGFGNTPGATYTWLQNGTILPETGTELNVNQPGLYELIIDLNTGDCERLEGQAIVEFYDNPQAFDAQLIQCDEDGMQDGFTSFNLNEAFSDLTGGSNTVFIEFYPSAMDAEDGSGMLNAIGYNNLSNPEILFAKVIDNNTGCHSISQLRLEVSSTQIGDYLVPGVCDELNSEDGINTFDLDEITLAIQADNSLTFPVSYYESYNDALLEQNELVSPYTNTNPYNQRIFSRVENNNACYGIGQVILTINPLPELKGDETFLYCLNDYPETITIDAGILNDNPQNYTYNWSSGQDTYEIGINEIGVYTVTATNIYGCSKSRNISIEPSNIATFESFDIVDASPNNSITVFVSGEGEYDYALFNENGLFAYWQQDNVFTNVPPGIYTVQVRDLKNDCGIVEELVSVIGFPKFFTPNGDGSNDTWNVKGVSGMFQPTTRILIFDRYGKLLKELSPLSEGWDGTFNGNPLPTGGYWFSVQLEDGRLFKSHFTLKR